MYALLFAHAGLSEAKISLLFTIWSAVAILAEVPTGALADRFSRRWSLVAAGVLQAAGYTLWITMPTFGGFAAGFVLWGLGGALVSGAFEALLYDGLTAAGAGEHYPRVFGRVTAIELLAQIPSAGAAALLYTIGGYPLVGWVSVAMCLTAAALAARLPEPARTARRDEDAVDRPDEASVEEDVEGSYLATLRAGLAAAAAVPAVRMAVIAVAVLTGFDAVDEYFPLLARDWGVSTAWTPIAVLGIPLAGAAGAALAGPVGRLGRRGLGFLVALSAAVFGLAGALRRPAGLALVAVFYGLYRLVLVIVEARLQHRIEGTSRATVTSVAGVGTEITTFAFYGTWTLGGVPAVAGLLLLIAIAVPYLLRPWPGHRTDRHRIRR